MLPPPQASAVLPFYRQTGQYNGRVSVDLRYRASGLDLLRNFHVDIHSSQAIRNHIVNTWLLTWILKQIINSNPGPRDDCDVLYSTSHEEYIAAGETTEAPFSNMD